jgi:hypothetical protein
LSKPDLNLVIVDLSRSPERGASASPSKPRSEKLRRHNPTVGNDTPASAAI